MVRRDDDEVGSARTAAADVASAPTVASVASAQTMASVDGPAAAPETLSVVPPDVYIQLDEFARGGLGRIIRAKDTRTGRIVAIKEMLSSSEDAAMRFAREAMITANLQHPAIVPVYEIGRWSTNDQPFYAMKLVSGRPLDQVIATTKTIDDRLRLVSHVLAVADALAYAHGERVIHRDLKPHNVLVGAYGETVVIDWGLARRLDEADRAGAPPDSDVPGQTYVGAVMGTPAYMPPEQASGVRVDERADVYAIGAILYQLLTGAPPYAGKTLDELLDRVKAGPPRRLAEIDASIPADLAAIAERAMAREPAQRYASAAELAADLRRFTTGQLVRAHRYTAMQRLGRFVSRNRAAVVIATAAIVAGGIGGAIAVHNVMAARDDAKHEQATAESARDEVKRRLVAAHVDRARVELAEGHDDMALAFTIAAAEVNGLDDRLRFIAARALAHIQPVHRGSGADLINAAFAPKSHHLLVGRRGELFRWDPAANKVIWRREGRVANLAIDAAANQLVVSGPEGIQQFDASTGALVDHVEPPAGKELIGFLGIDIHHRWLAMSVKGGGVLVHDRATKTTEIRPLASGTVMIVSSDGQRLVVEIQVSDVQRRLAIVDREGREVVKICNKCVRIDNIGDDLIVADQDAPYHVKILRWTGTVLADIELTTNVAVNEFAIAADQLHFALTTTDGTLEMHHRKDGRLWQTRVTDRIDAAQFDGRGRLWIAGPFAGVNVFDAATGTQLARWSQIQAALVIVSDDSEYVAGFDIQDSSAAWPVPPLPVAVVAPTPARVRRIVFLDDDRFVSASDDGLLALHENGTWKELGRHAQRIVNVELVGGDKVLTSSRDNTAVLRELATGREVVRIPDKALRATASLDGTIAIGSVDGTVAIWDNGAARELGLLKSEVAGLAWSPDGTLIAAIDSDGAIEVWRRDGTKVRSIAARGRVGIELTFSPRGTWLARSDIHGGLEQLHSLVAGVPDRELPGISLKEHLTSAYVFSPDESEVTIGGDGILVNWNLVTGKVLDLRPRSDTIAAVRSETLLYAGGLDRRPRAYDLARGDEITSIEAVREVYGLAKSPDDRKLAVLTLGAALIWDIAPFTGDLAQLKTLAACGIEVEVVAGEVRRRTIDAAACNAR